MLQSLLLQQTFLVLLCFTVYLDVRESHVFRIRRDSSVVVWHAWETFYVLGNSRYWALT